MLKKINSCFCKISSERSEEFFLDKNNDVDVDAGWCHLEYLKDGSAGLFHSATRKLLGKGWPSEVWVYRD